MTNVAGRYSSISQPRETIRNGLSTRKASRKWVSCASTIDSGSTSRGKYTFLMSWPLPTMAWIEPWAEVWKNCHSR